jgi:hypothetical protein
MKKLAYLVFIIPMCISCGGEAEEETSEEETSEEVVEEEIVEEVVNSVLIESGSVGIFKIGEAVPTLPEELSLRHFNEVDVNIEGEEMEHKHNVIFNILEDVVELIMDHTSGEHHEDLHIEEMYVLSNYYATEEGITIGTSIEDFTAEFPDYKIWYSRVGNEYVIETEAYRNMYFLLSADDCTKEVSGNKDMEELKITDFNEEAKIKKIRLF